MTVGPLELEGGDPILSSPGSQLTCHVTFLLGDYSSQLLNTYIDKQVNRCHLTLLNVDA